jgi:hypothetical protein
MNMFFVVGSITEETTFYFSLIPICDLQATNSTTQTLEKQEIEFLKAKALNKAQVNDGAKGDKINANDMNFVRTCDGTFYFFLASLFFYIYIYM